MPARAPTEADSICHIPLAATRVLSQIGFRQPPLSIDDICLVPRSKALVVTFSTQSDLDAYWQTKALDPSITTYAADGEYSIGKARIEAALREAHIPFHTALLDWDHQPQKRNPSKPGILIARNDIPRAVAVIKALIAQEPITFPHELAELNAALEQATDREVHRPASFSHAWV